jgi:hypothetical protein
MHINFNAVDIAIPSFQAVLLGEICLGASLAMSIAGKDGLSIVVNTERLKKLHGDYTPFTTPDCASSSCESSVDVVDFKDSGVASIAAT